MPTARASLGARLLSCSEPLPHPTPPACLSWLEDLIADLSSAYAPTGIRQWLRRPRVQLDDLSPLQVLGADWSPDSAAARPVRELAASLRS